MKVKHHDVAGTLITVNGHLLFIPDDDKYGPNRIFLEDGHYHIHILDKEDDDCIYVTGMVGVENGFYKKDNFSFYPVKN